MLALQRVWLLEVSTMTGLELSSYLVRLLAYLLILAGIVDKNLRP